MRCPDLVTDAVAWALVETRLMVSTKGHPYHPRSQAIGWVLVMVPVEETGLSHQECQVGGQSGRGPCPRDL